MSSRAYSSSTNSSRRRSTESLPLIIVPPKSYGSLLPYYEFVRSTIRWQSHQVCNNYNLFIIVKIYQLNLIQFPKGVLEFG